MKHKLQYEFFQKYYGVHEHTAVKNSFSTYLRMLYPGRFILVESVCMRCRSCQYFEVLIFYCSPFPKRWFKHFKYVKIPFIKLLLTNLDQKSPIIHSKVGPLTSLRNWFLGYFASKFSRKFKLQKHLSIFAILAYPHWYGQHTANL